MTGFERHQVETPAGEAFPVLQWGERGRPLMLHHATGFCAAMWDRIATELARDHVVFALDARGHGDAPAATEVSWQSYADDLVAVSRAVLEKIGAESFTGFLGHSLGGIAGLTAAVADPALFDRLVLVEPVLIPASGPGARKPGRTPFSMAARMRKDRFASITEAREVIASQVPYTGFDPQTLDDYFRFCFEERDGGEVALRCSPSLEGKIYELGPTPVLEGLDGFDRPTVVLAARDSSFAAGYRSLREPFQVVQVDASHVIPMERPDEVLRFARQTLEG